MNLARFFAELKRRHVYRAAVAYGMVAWLLTQVATQVFPFFDIPNSAVRFVIVALLLGFPIAMLLAWLYEFTGEGFVREKDVDPQKRQSAARVSNFVIIGVLLLLIAVLIYGRLPSRSASGEPIPEKSIAVLPFANFSDDKQNAFFADGIQDDILTSLAKIRDLRVISRSSVMQFRDPGAHNLREIGKLLGVANVLEGSVRREGDKVVVNVQLIDALKDRHLWANRYDRRLADSLGLQGELATEIAEALRVTLTADEKARVAKKPTENEGAYVLYLRANQISRNPDTLLEDYRKAEQLYGEAIALDPNFALAHAQLASTRAQIFHYYEPTEELKTKARTEAELALRLQPDLADAHLALAQCIYWIDHDYPGALAQFELASRLSPSNGDAVRLSAAIQRRQGKWERALEEYERAQRLDPQNASTIRELLFTNTAMRRWEEASRWAERLRAMAPASLTGKIQSGYVDLWWKGDTATLRKLVAEIPIDTDPDGVVTSVRWEIAMINREFGAAQEILEKAAAKEVSYTNAGTTPKTFLLGCTLLARGARAGAEKLFEQALPEFETAVKEAPDDANRHANLGWCYAFMGRKEDAIREGRRAVDLKPESKDALDGSLMSAYLALIYARTGENDRAITLIDRLLKIPGPIDSADYSITVNDLKFRWEWDPIRNDPRFQKLISTKP